MNNSERTMVCFFLNECLRVDKLRKERSSIINEERETRTTVALSSKVSTYTLESRNKLWRSGGHVIKGESTTLVSPIALSLIRRKMQCRAGRVVDISFWTSDFGWF